MRPRRLTASIVFRIPQSKLEQVRQLSERTRVLQSVYLREAIRDLIRKYEVPDHG